MTSNAPIGGSPVDRSPSVSSERVSQEGSSYSACMSSSIGDSTPKTTIFDNLKSLTIGRVLSNLGSYLSRLLGGENKVSHLRESIPFIYPNELERSTFVDFLFNPSESIENDIPSRSIAQKMTNNIVQAGKFFLGFMAFGRSKDQSSSEIRDSTSKQMDFNAFFNEASIVAAEVARGPIKAINGKGSEGTIEV